MNVADARTTRASLEAARVALGRMMGEPALAGVHAPPRTMAARSREAWASIESVLRTITGRTDLDGQMLLAESRRVDALDMDGMHSLVALREWMERTMLPGSAAQMLTLPPTEAEIEVAATAMAALDRAIDAAVMPGTPVAHAAPATPAMPVSSGLPVQPATSSRSPWAPQPIGDVVNDVNVLTPRPPSAWAPPALPVAAAAASGSRKADLRSSDDSQAVREAGGDKRSMSSGLIMGIALLIIAISSVGAYFYVRDRGGAESALTEQGVADYARGAKESARVAFAKAVQDHPNDARALTYLGRIAREQGSTTTARQYLENAIRLDPNSALASREMASALLADQQYELARRFYVRALSVDPADRVAQGFLACSLFKLNRNEEAQRWMDRAGTGEWSVCLPAPIAAPSKD